MAEHPFRILVDFRELSFKFYKFVWMSISPRELVTIKDLKEAILKKFSIERTDLLLFLRDGLLPEDENISNILRENDNVRLFYAEPSNLNLNHERNINHERIDSSTSDSEPNSSKKRKTHSDVSINLEDNNEQVKSSKKRKHSFSNGTYLFENNSTPEISALTNTVPDNIENVDSANLYSFENEHGKSCKKKLKYSNDASQISLISENEAFPSSDNVPRSERNESRVNSCKKKKKHKHSKDISENEINFHNVSVTVSEINENEPMSHKKKKKHKHSRSASKTDSLSKTAVSFSDEILGVDEKLDESINDMDSKNSLSELKESIFKTVIDDSEILKLTPVSFYTSSVNTSSGIGSLKSSEGNNQKVSSENNCNQFYVTVGKQVSELKEDNQSVQGNNCKKKKRKRHRKRKSLFIDPLDVSNDCKLSITPQKNEDLDSNFTSTPYQIAETSFKNKENSDNSNSSNNSRTNKNCSETRNIFLEPFSSSYPPSPSIPFRQTNVASPRSNIVSKIPSYSNVSEKLSSSVTSCQNAIQKKMNGNSLTTHSLPCGISKNKDNATVSSRNSREKSLPAKINRSFEKSTDSFSNIRIKSESLDPNFSYKDCPPLNSCPLIGTRIAYKVLELDASYSPVVSNYKEGLVKAVNSQTDELEIELIEPEVKEGRIGKFENIYDDEFPPCEVIRNVTLSWPSLIDPVRVEY